jgi:hypothetical protein
LRMTGTVGIPSTGRRGRVEAPSDLGLVEA